MSCNQEKSESTDAPPPDNSTQITTDEKPLKHLKLQDLTSMEEALKVFNDTTAQIKSKTKLDAQELSEIHVITYSLEKAIAYFTDNLTGAKQEAAKKIAVIVEEIHLASENNRQEETRKHMDEYFKVAEAFKLLSK